MKLQTMRDTCQGMNFLHSQPQPIIHRDLKSFNLLVDSYWAVKVSGWKKKIHTKFLCTC